MKQLMTAEKLIIHMKSKGITFNIVSEEEAKHFLAEHNYYLKLASYRANYKKYSSGKRIGQYQNLDFAYLKELSTIDMHLRYIIVQMALDIEHYLKVKLLSSIEDNPDEDGYHLIQCFFADDNNFSALKEIQRHKSSDYCKSLIEKYYPFFPAWVYVELISFGQLAYLCDFYNQLYGIEIGDRILLNSVRDIRNACAHSNCLINKLQPGNNRPHQSVVDRIKLINGISEQSRDKKLSNKCIYDFVCLVYAYNEIVTSEATKKYRYNELNDLFTGRMKERKDYFSKNNLITSSVN
jgi:abortive infection bacteriophage resistance protein